MARLKSDRVKWTLVLVLTVFSQYVFSLPQLNSTTLDVVPNAGTEKSTADPLRYNFIQNNGSLYLFMLPSNNSVYKGTRSRFLNGDNKNISQFNVSLGRIGRLRKTKRRIKPNYDTLNDEIQYSTFNNKLQSQNNDQLYTNKKLNKPVIKKVITKWTDNTKYDELNISHDDNDSNEKDTSNLVNLVNSNVQYSSTENVYAYTNEQPDNKRFTYSYNRPQYSEEAQVYSNNFHVVDRPYVTRPSYVFSTPTPTPIITNVGYPKPWQNNKPIKRPTTRKPIKGTKPKKPQIYHSHPNYSPYPGNDFEVTTFPPTMGYTERIVIRPNEYSASSDECPTIFLTLNNTFQGQAKEACPDLNIAVNTNVINKNVVVESEEDTDTTLTDVFGLPLDDSGSDESDNDYTESQENDEQTDSASVELSSYNAANSVSEAESSEPASVASPSTALSSYAKPSRPNDNDDDVFSFSSVIDFFRPAISAFSWLAAINPLSFSALSFLLTPVILLFAGTSGLFALFSPWSLSARAAPDVSYYGPPWQWDDYYKAWHLNSFPNSRTFESESAKSKGIHVDTTWFYKVKEFLKTLTKTIKERNGVVNYNRKNKRKKRETWTIRVK
ncbi:unnamed protein product [Euphydryas editha]|uniref:Uncharacterized protein n=1 Tax=Euphydryas editha TaxID=104508 RepID=A0AAU9TTU4_EUPED|nr:unnamed protein product [Euphydryas editha]